MSWKVQAAVGERVCGSITRKMVLLNMASRANDDGTGVYASLSMIAGWCEVDARTVRRIVRDLEAEGLIVHCGWRAVKNGQINEWRVDVEAVEKLPLYRDEVAAKRIAKMTPDTVSGVVKRRRKTKAYGQHPGHSVPPDTRSARTHGPKTPDTAPASSIQEPIPLFEEATASPNRGTVIQLRPGEGSQAVELYVKAAKRLGWTVPRKINAKRQTAIRARLREEGGLDGWREQLLAAEEQPFLAGENSSGWVMDIDFFASARGWLAISERKYLNATSRQLMKASTNDHASSASDEPLIRRGKVSRGTASLLRKIHGSDALDLGRVESERIK